MDGMACSLFSSRHLLRLLRAMQFLQKVLENTAYSNSENLKDSFKEVRLDVMENLSKGL